MQVQVEPVGPCRMRVSVTVGSAHIASHLEGVYRQVSQQASMKGFRPGHVPRRILEQQFGSQILHEARESLMTETFREAITDKQLAVIGNPELDGQLGELKPDQDFSYQVQVDVRPQFELKEVRGIEAARRPTDVTDEELEGVIQQIAAQKRKLTLVDSEVQSGDFIRVDMTYRNDGKDVLERKGLQINTQIPVAGTDPEEFAAKLTGKRKDEAVVIPLTYPATFEKEDLRGKPGEVGIRILEVSRVVAPTLDDELARQYDFESMDKMRTTLRERVGKEKVRQEEARQQEDILTTLIADHPFEVPARLVKQEAEFQLNRVREELKQRNAPAEEIDKQVEALRAQADTAAERNVRTFFLIESVARREKIFVTETEVEAELKAIAANHQTTYEEVRRAYEEQNLMSQLRSSLVEAKVRKFLRDNARFTDKPE